MPTDAYYSSMEFQMAGKVIGLSEHLGRASVPMGPGFNPAARFMTLQTILDADGRERYVGQRTKDVLAEVMRLIVAGEWNTTMRDMGATLKCAPSTVSRALRRLMAFGLIGYLTTRGKYGGITLFQRERGDGLDHFARDAWALIKAQAERRWQRFVERVSRSISNVASYGEQTKESWMEVYNPIQQVLVRKDATLDRAERENALRERDERVAAALGIDPGRPMRRVRCPAHGGQDRNLAWKWSQRGRLLLTCHSHHCTYAEIVAAVGL